MLGMSIFQKCGKLLLGDALDTRARARGRATRWKGSMPALAREPLIRVSRSFFASVRAIRNRAFPGARRFRVTPGGAHIPRVRTAILEPGP